MKINDDYNKKIKFLEKMRDFFKENDLVLEFDVTSLDELEINVKSDKNNLKFKVYGWTFGYEDFNYLIYELKKLKSLELKKNKNKNFKINSKKSL